MTHRLWLFVALLAIVLTACTTTQPEIASEIPMITDTDLDAAGALPFAGEAGRTALDLALPTLDALDAVPNRDTLTPGIVLEDTHLPSGEGTPGYLIFVQDRRVGSAKYSLRLGDGNEPHRPARLIYRGKREIESAAVTTDGGLVIFTMRSRAGDLDPYLLDIEGAFGKRKGVYLLPSTSYDESDMSMSLDGSVHAYQSFDEATGTSNYFVLLLDRSSGALSAQTFNISLGGNPIVQNDPSLTGDGSAVVFVVDDAVAFAFFGAPIIVSFQTDGSGGAIPYGGLPGLSEALFNPSASFDGGQLMFRETFAGIDFLSLVGVFSGSFADILAGPAVEHPYLIAEGNAFTFAFEGRIYTGAIDPENPGVPSIDALPDVQQKFFGSAPYWAQELQPPPPPPPGTISYDGTTVGGPTFDRPDGVGPSTVGPVAYHATGYTAESDGVYDFASAQDYDGYLHLYSSPFDPAQPLVNVIAGNDDLGNNRNSGFRLFLESGEYVVVTSAFAAGDEGTFTNTIIPPQPAVPGEAPVIELFSTDLLVVGTGETLTIEWFVSSAEALSCSVDWGDGTVDPLACSTDTIQSASHSYAAEGPYTVTFSASNANGSTEASAFPTVANDDPGAFDIVVVFANDLLSPGQRAAFQDAADRWAEVIIADLPAAQPGDVPADFSCVGEPAFNGFVDDVVISAFGANIDGAGGVLASAGPCLFRADGTNGALAALPVYGIMRFDVADLANLEAGGGLFSTILHEMGHVLGIGTLWEPNGLIDFVGDAASCRNVGTFTTDPTFNGIAGNTQFGILGGVGGAPIEESFGPGTQCGHWDEVTFGTELMTGFLNIAAVEPLSILTAGSLTDLGYTVDLTAADPFIFPVTTLRDLGAPLGYDVVLDNVGKNKR